VPPEERPALLVLVAGTHTEVGKTWATAELAKRLRAAGYRTVARKPVQSYEVGAGPTDADVLAAATGEDPIEVCPAERWLPVPMAPPMAADVLGRPAPTISALVAGVRWPADTHVGLLESVGGVRSPIAEDGDTVELAAAVRPNLVVLVADARLGAINAVLTSLPALSRWTTTVLLNRFDPSDDLHRRNLRWLAGRHHLDVCTDVDQLAQRIHPRLPGLPLETS
jgi:dethiobiotin synthetase